MKTEINTTINIMGEKSEMLISFDIFGFTVSIKGYIVDGGFFGYNGKVYFTETTRFVELFSDVLEKKVIKEMKKKKEAWSKMVKYQNSKK